VHYSLETSGVSTFIRLVIRSIPVHFLTYKDRAEMKTKRRKNLYNPCCFSVPYIYPGTVSTTLDIKINETIPCLLYLWIRNMIYCIECKRYR
jgi:hypothetical protein